MFDDYVQHFPTPIDADRLATSVRVAARTLARSRPAGGAGADAGAAKEAPRRPVVLVVEDDEVLHTLVAAMLAPKRSTSSSKPTVRPRSTASARSSPTSC